MEVEMEIRILLLVVITVTACSHGHHHHRGVSDKRQIEEGEYCASDVFNATCSNDEVIAMQKASYGRMSMGRCIRGNYGMIGCADDVLHELNNRCTGKKQCSFAVSELTNSYQPCPAGDSVWLQASYACVKDGCKTSTLGKEYTGIKSFTKEGRGCQRWDSQTPHKHTHNNDAKLFPDATLKDAQNYCRNPDDAGHGPWCYTTDKDKPWEYCDVPTCTVDGCKATTLGKEYMGTTDSTISGRRCQRWDSQFPHKTNTKSQDASNFPESTLADAHNYCRNPDSAPTGPWCYTTDKDKSWEYCDVPQCIVDGCKTTTLGKEYSGKTKSTIGAKLCQRWDTQSPHKTNTNSQDAGNFPDATLSDAENYCRNPDDAPKGPWCYTTDPKTSWQYCDVPKCEVPTTTADPNIRSHLLWIAQDMLK